MNILYHLTAPPPKIENTDAVYQEAESLRRKAGGELIHLYPLPSPNSFFPWFLFGMQKIPYLLQHEKNYDFHHLYAVHLYPFPYLFFLKKPIIYSVTTVLKPRLTLLAKKWIRSLHTIVISHERDKVLLDELKITNFRLIRPGIDTSKFFYSPLSIKNEFILLVGSAPWTRQQFYDKGIDQLLDAAVKSPRLKLVFLWRGLLLKELEARIIRRGLVTRTEVINEKQDVNKVLAQVHATVVLAQRSSLVKSYPHSLMESLCAGKPVLLSQCIPMADYVDQNKCGVVISHLEINGIVESINKLMNLYDGFQKNALNACRNDFDMERHMQDYVDLYQEFAK